MAQFQSGDVTSLFDADFLAGGSHPLALGLTDEIAYLKKQGTSDFCPCWHN